MPLVKWLVEALFNVSTNYNHYTTNFTIFHTFRDNGAISCKTQIRPGGFVQNDSLWSFYSPFVYYTFKVTAPLFEIVIYNSV